MSAKSVAANKVTAKIKGAFSDKVTPNTDFIDEAVFQRNVPMTKIYFQMMVINK